MARSITRRRASSNTRKVARPAQGAHTNDRYPVTIAAGGDNVNSGAVRVPRVNNGKPRRAT